MASISGNSILIKIDGEILAGQKGATINYNTTDVDTTVKLNAGWTNAEAETNEWDISCDGLLELSCEGYKKLKKAWREKRKVEVEYGGTKEGDSFEKGMALISSISESAPLNDRCTFSANFKGTGQLVEATREPAEEDEDGGSL